MTTLDLTTASEGHSSASRGSVPNVPARAHDGAVAAVVGRDARSDSPLTHLDLFSGIGGFALAAQIAGFETVGFCEVDDYASKVLAKHWPKVKNYGDITTADFSGVGKITVLTGGFPCQPYSVAGNRKGASDDRALWPEMLRVIGVVRPAWIIGENVAGLISLELDRVLFDLEAIGYSTRAFVVPAVGVDARHRRERLWILAHAEGINRGLQLPTWHEEEGIESEWRGENVADANETGRREQCRAESVASEQCAAECSREIVGDSPREQAGRLQQREIPTDACAASDRRGKTSWWPTEPGICRVADGIPNRTHRLKGLGNAIVPQVPLPFFDAIAALEATAAVADARREVCEGAHERVSRSSETQAQND